jgi:Ca2+/Na+ antiporter
MAAVDLVALALLLFLALLHNAHLHVFQIVAAEHVATMVVVAFATIKLVHRIHATH